MYKDNEGVLPTIPNWCIIIIQMYITKENEKIRNFQEILEFDSTKDKIEIHKATRVLPLCTFHI